MSQVETVDQLIEYIESKLNAIELTQSNPTEANKEMLGVEFDGDEISYDEQRERNETKLTLLKEWKENHNASIELSDGGCYDKSDKIDDRCIEIEEHFEREYDIKFDSYGDIES